MPMMPGADFKKIRQAIVTAFDDDELKMVLKEEMNVKLDNVVGPGKFNTRVFELLEWLEKQGRETELIRAVAMALPQNNEIQAVYKTYGMAVPVYIEQAGAGVPDSPTDATQAGLEGIVEPHLEFIKYGIWRERMTGIEGRVCQIAIGGAPCGTGFLVGPDAVLTNYHVLQPVINRLRESSEVECIFDFKTLSDGSTLRNPVKLHADWEIESLPPTLNEVRGKPDETVPNSDELDFSLIRLVEPIGSKPWAANPGSGASNRGWIPVSESPPQLKSPMGIIIAQHPLGWPLKLAIDTHAINRSASPPRWTNSNGTRVRYATNTESGSSGSPVFNMEWNLIALHHYGDKRYEHPRFNQGVPIDKIREHLKQCNKVAALGGEPE